MSNKNSQIKNHFQPENIVSIINKIKKTINFLKFCQKNINFNRLVISRFYNFGKMRYTYA